MPDVTTDSGSPDGGGITILQGYVSTSGAGNNGVLGELDTSGSGGTGSGGYPVDDGIPYFTLGTQQTDLIGGVIDQVFPNPNFVLQASSGSFQPNFQPQGQPLQAQVQKQVVKLDIRNTVVLPLEPCRTASYIKLVFLPIDPEFRFKREHRRETSIPFPKKVQLTVPEFKSKFDGKVHTGDIRYLLRWNQILPVVVQPQDTESVDYKTTDVYDFRTSIHLNDENVLQWLDMSELPLTQVTKAEDVQGGTLDIDSLELYLDDVIFAHLDESTGRLIGKDPVEAGIFLS